MRACVCVCACIGWVLAHAHMANGDWQIVRRDICMGPHDWATIQPSIYMHGMFALEDARSELTAEACTDPAIARGLAPSASRHASQTRHLLVWGESTPIGKAAIHHKSFDTEERWGYHLCATIKGRYTPVEDLRTPGESGRPRVATPEPACTRKESAWPW